MERGVLSASVRSTLNLGVCSTVAGVSLFAPRAQADRMSAIHQRSRYPPKHQRWRADTKRTTRKIGTLTARISSAKRL
jgi:hypothetical protein